MSFLYYKEFKQWEAKKVPQCVPLVSLWPELWDDWSTAIHVTNTALTFNPCKLTGIECYSTWPFKPVCFLCLPFLLSQRKDLDLPGKFDSPWVDNILFPGIFICILFPKIQRTSHVPTHAENWVLLQYFHESSTVAWNKTVQRFH